MANLSPEFFLAPGKDCQDDPLKRKQRQRAPELCLQGLQLETVCAGNRAAAILKRMKASSSKILTHIDNGI